MTRMRGEVSILVLLVSMSMTLISMGSLVYVMQQFPADQGTPDEGDESGTVEDGGVVDPSLPPYWGHVPPLPSCDALPHFPTAEAFAEGIGDPPVWYSYGGPPKATAIPGGSSSALDASGVAYSTTNNQVEGVDEADIVKTDGRYVYAASGNVVTIARAYPPEEAHAIVRIPIPATVVGLFVNGDRLVVFGSAHAWTDGVSYVTRVQILDIEDRASPKIVHEVALGGWYQGSRMIDEFVYVAANGYVYNGTDGYLLPAIWTDGTRGTLTYADIGVLPEALKSASITLLLALRITGDDPTGCVEAVQSPWESWWNGGAMYVSPRNVYLARYSWSTANPPSSQIHRFSVDGGRIIYTGSARVPGTILNQFSMDEHGGHFRVATSTRSEGTNVYVLDDSLEIVGRLEGLAPGETMHSARFLGERAYLVTFEKIDPFFVVDLSDPTSPHLLGELKIPGFSDYLHPYGENLVIGLGKDTYDMGTFAWFQGVKLSLFDVSDMANPREVSTLVIGDRGTQSEATWDHRAFLLDREQGFLVLPIDLAVIDRLKHPDPPPDMYGTHVWQGAYVISVNPVFGFRVTATISHEDPDRVPTCFATYGCNAFGIRRSLYIGEYLYTVSPSAIEIHEIGSFREVGQVSL